MRRIIAIALSLAFLLAAPIKVTATVITTATEEHIRNELNRANFPSAAVAVIQGGETSFILENSEMGTLFQIGSLAKSFTGFGVLLLEDMGLLSVHDLVNQHLPWFDVHYNGVPVTVTIYNLLHNTSGISSDERIFPSIWLENRDEFIAELAGAELVFYPGTGYRYGNANFIVLGFLIEAVSGLSYDEFMTQNVLHPLGLHNTFTSVENAHATGRVAGGNRMGFFAPRSHEPVTSPLAIPTGFVYSSVADMARWAEIQLGALELSDQMARIIKRSHQHNHASNTPFADMSYFYGAGWRIELETGIVRHGGETPGYTATLIIRPEDNTAVMVLGNRHYGSTLQFGRMVLDALDGVILDSMGMDLFAILDIAFVVLAAAGVLYIGFFIRLAIKTSKRFQNGETIKANFTIKTMMGIFNPIISIVLLLGFYIGFPEMNGNAFSSIMPLMPASTTTAIIALWIMAVYSLCGWLVNAFVKST